MIAWMLAMALLQADARCNAVNAAPPPPRGCTAWRPLFRSDEAEVLADHGSVRRTARGFDLTVRIILATAQPTGTRSGIVTYRFDCTAATGTMLHARYFDAAGRQLSQGPTPDARPIPSPPGSPNRLALDRWCPR